MRLRKYGMYREQINGTSTLERRFFFPATAQEFAYRVKRIDRLSQVTWSNVYVAEIEAEKKRQSLIRHDLRNTKLREKYGKPPKGPMNT